MSKTKPIVSTDLWREMEKNLRGLEVDLATIQNVKEALMPGLILPETFILEINYRHTIEALVVAGRFDRAKRCVSSRNFPLCRDGLIQVEAKLFGFSGDLALANVIRRILLANQKNRANAPLSSLKSRFYVSLSG